MSNLTISTDDSFFKSFQQYVEKSKKFEIDPLVLSVSAKELSEKFPGTHYNLYDDKRLLDNISDATKNRVEEIRKYYSKKLFWNNLNGVDLSPIRHRMSVLLEHKVLECNDNDIGIYWKLPYFYEEDCVYDDFKEKYNTDRLSPLGNKVSNRFAKRLSFLKTTSSCQKNGKTKNYWFSDDNQDLYAIQLSLGNELLSFFEDILEKNPTPIFETYLKESKIDKLHFYKLYSYKLLKELNA